MKDIPRPSSYGSVYVPPHHRHRSVVAASAPSPSPNISSAPHVVLDNTNSFVSSSQSNSTNRFTVPYPYLPPPQVNKPQVDNVPQEGPHGQFVFSVQPGVPTSDIDSWKWRLTTLLNSKDQQELISREKKDRRDYEQISALANSMGLHSHLYAKVLVISKVPLPNYRFDLDDKRPQREVALPQGLQKRVEAHLKEYISHKSKTMKGSENDLNSKTSINGSIIGNDEVLFEIPELPLQSKAAIEKLLWRRSVQLQTEQRAYQESSEGWRMLQLRKNLPAYKERDAIINAIKQNQVVIISGETGCGKTTQIPQFILESEIDHFRGATCSIICTQPRRISTMSVSERIATERGEKLGETVGYKVRLEGMKGRDTRLLFCTTGILLRRLLADRNLKDVTHVIVDEIHERGMNEDFLLIVLKELLPRRPELRLVLMSATLDANLFSNYFGGVPVVQIPGFTHPVHSYFLEDVLETTGYRLTADNQVDDYGQERTWKSNKQFYIKKRKSQIASAVEESLACADFRGYSLQTQSSMACWNPDCMGFNLIEFLLLAICGNEKPGAVLVFMTGWDDISSLKDKLQANPLLGDSSRVLLLACHGSMASSEQRVIFEKPEHGVRKIVLATNMAETSITIDDVVYVIDCGKAKETSYDALNNTPCLLPAWISKVSAKQRRGRAGRVQPGECYHLYPRCVYNAFAEYQLPEILRTPLQSLCLQIKTLKLGSISEFLSKALQSPELLAVQNAIEYLKIIGALDEKENLTVLGRYLTMLPVEPKLGKMLILGAILNCLDPILTVVAGLSVRDPFLAPLDKKDLAEAAKAQFSWDHSDHFALVRAYEGWKVAERELGGYEYCWKNFLSAQSMKAIDSLRREFLSLLKDTGLIDGNIVIFNAWSYDDNLMRAVICYGLYPGISSIVHNEKSFSLKTMEDGQVLLHSNSVNSRDPRIPFPWLVFNEKIKVNSVFLRDTTAVSDSVLLLFGGSISRGDADGVLKMLGGYLEFFMEPSMAEMYLNVRKELDELFQWKLLNPKMDLHTHHELLSAVRLLLPEDQSVGRFVFNRFDSSKPSYITSVPLPPPQLQPPPQLPPQPQPQLQLRPQSQPQLPVSRVESGPGGDNAKSQLQTLLARAGYPAPIYRTSQLANNQFRSVCEFNGMQITGHACHNKKQAEKDAAAEAIDHLIGGTGGTHASLLKKSKTKHN